MALGKVGAGDVAGKDNASPSTDRQPVGKSDNQAVEKSFGKAIDIAKQEQNAASVRYAANGSSVTGRSILSNGNQPGSLNTANPASPTSGKSNAASNPNPAQSGMDALTATDAFLLARHITFGEDAFHFSPVPKVHNTFGPQIEVTTENNSFRVGKFWSGQYTNLERYNEPFPNAPRATLESIDTFDSSTYPGWMVETNFWKTKTEMPWQKGEKPTSLFAEGIVNVGRVAGALRQEFEFPSIGEAKKFAERHRNADDGLSLAEAYRQYTGGRGTPLDPTGRDITFSVAPLAFKAYGSISANEIVGNYIDRGLKALSGRLPRNVPEDLAKRALNLAHVIPYAVGAYGEVGGSIQCGGKYSTYSHTSFDNGAARVDDLNPGAHNAIVAQCNAGLKLFGAASIGVDAPAAFLREYNVNVGKGWVYDEYWNDAQRVYMTEYGVRWLDGNEQSFRDSRLNSKVANPYDMGGMQGLYGNLAIQGRVAKSEVRENLPGPNGQPLSDRQTLMNIYRAEARSGVAEFRIHKFRRQGQEAIFSEAWEDSARASYEQKVAGKELTDKEWSDVLGRNLSDSSQSPTSSSWFDPSSWFPSSSTAEIDWARNNITQEQKDLYAQWPGYAQRFIDWKEREVAGMDYHELYNACFAVGIRPRGVYLASYDLARGEQMAGGGVSIKKPEPASRNEDWFLGLYQSRWTNQFDTINQSLSLASTPEAWPEFKSLLETPKVGDAVLKYYNRYDLPRQDPQGNEVTPSILSIQMYNGVTPTREMEQFQLDIERRRNMSGVDHIYTVSKNDMDFTDIGRRALTRLTGHAVTRAEAEAYGHKIRKLNFKAKAVRFGTFAPGAGDANPEVFPRAFLILPSVSAVGTP